MSDILAPSTIRGDAAARQLVDFRGLWFGKRRPTDIDGYLDFDGRMGVFIEFKYGDTSMDRGQELAYERLLKSVRVMHLFILAMHNARADEPIDTASAAVRSYWWTQGKGVIQRCTPAAPMTPRELISRTLRRVGLADYDVAPFRGAPAGAPLPVLPGWVVCPDCGHACRAERLYEGVCWVCWYTRGD